MSQPSGQYYPVPVGDDRRAAVRASDADRERAHSFLSAAMSTGVLATDEYTDRAANAMVAVTLADLDALCADLPLGQIGGALAASTPTEIRVSSSGAEPLRKAKALLSSAAVGGGSVVADSMKVSAVLASVELDLRDVEFTAAVLTIKVRAVFGSVRIVVPPDVTVEIHGSSVVGSFNAGAAGRGSPGAPRVVIRGSAFMGGVDVERIARGQYIGPTLPR